MNIVELSRKGIIYLSDKDDGYYNAWCVNPEYAIKIGDHFITYLQYCYEDADVVNGYDGRSTNPLVSVDGFYTKFENVKIFKVVPPYF